MGGGGGAKTFLLGSLSMLKTKSKATFCMAF